MKKCFYYFLSLFPLFLLVFFLRTPIKAAGPYLKTTIPMPDGAHPRAVSVDAIRHKAFVITENPHKLVVLDTQSDLIVTSVPLSFLPLTPKLYQSKDEIYIAENNINKVAVFDTNTLTLKYEISLSGKPYRIAVNENTGRVYVTIYESDAVLGQVDVVDSNTQTVIDTINVAHGLWGIDVNSVTNKIYVSSARNDPGLTVINGSTDLIEATLYFDDVSNNTVVVDSALNRIYVINMFEAAIYVVDGSNNNLITKITIPDLGYYRYPFGLALDPTLHKLYTGASNAESFVQVIDTNLNSPVQRIEIDPPTADLHTNIGLLDIDTNLHKVYAPHYGNSFVAVISEMNTLPIADAGDDQTMVVNNTVSLNGSGSYDADSDPLNYSWSEDAGNPQTGILLNSNTVAPSFTPTVAGTYTFSLVVSDGFGDSAPDTVVIIIQTPVEAIQDLVYTVEDFNLQQGIEDSLDAKLANGQDVLSDPNQNNDIAAINSLQAFINAVEAQRSNQITNEQADILINAALTVINSLSV